MEHNRLKPNLRSSVTSDCRGQPSFSWPDFCAVSSCPQDFKMDVEGREGAQEVIPRVVDPLGVGDGVLVGGARLAAKGG